jgi:ribose 5-phosphate isomerase A
MDLKKTTAETAITFLKNKNLIGLGAGSTVANIIDVLPNIVKNNRFVKITTSSFDTCQLLQKQRLEVLPISSFGEIDIYIDGCDQVDRNLNALKSGGGIHTQEKLLANMAKEFILVGEEVKYVDSFDSRFPVVVDILPDAIHFVVERIGLLYPEAKTTPHVSNKSDNTPITDNGNFLIDIWFKEWPELSTLNSTLKGITGIIETSLFYDLAHKVILAGKDGVRILEKHNPVKHQ